MANLLSAFRYFPEAFRQLEAVGTRVFCCQTCFLGLELDSVVMWLRLVSAQIQFNSSLESVVTALNPNVQGQGFSSYQQDSGVLFEPRRGCKLTEHVNFGISHFPVGAGLDMIREGCAEVWQGGSCYALSGEDEI